MTCWPLVAGHLVSMVIFGVWVWLDHRALHRLYRHARKLDDRQLDRFDREVRYGTPDTPQRIATIEQADRVYRDSGKQYGR